LKLHLPSYLLGLATAGVVSLARERLRPVALEMTALGVHFGRIARAIVERQRENAEDLWAEIDERVRQRFRRGDHVNGREPAPATVSPS